MSTHYIKILKWLEDYARRISKPEGDWQQQIFEDLTDGGRELKVIPLPPNAQGPLIGLCGETFFCQAGLDQEREDSLFISRIESKERCPSTPSPKKIHAEFRLLTKYSSSLSQLDPVRKVISMVQAAQPPKREQSEKIIRPSSELLIALRAASPELSILWEPQLKTEPLEDSELLEQGQFIWRRFRVERYMQANADLRQKGLLRGTVRPASLGERDRGLLGSAFDLGVLNAFARDSRQPQRELYAFLEKLAGFSRDESLRALLWTTMLSDSAPSRLRRRLHSLASTLSGLSYSASKAWSPPVLELLRRKGKEGDERLGVLVEQAEEERAPLAFLAAWAARLQFSQKQEAPSPQPLSPLPESSPAEPSATVSTSAEHVVVLNSLPEPTANLSAPPSSKPSIQEPLSFPESPPFSRWVLALRGRSSADFDGIVQGVLEALDSWSKGSPDPWSVRDVLHLLEQLKRLQVQLQAWLQILPDAEVLKADVQEAGAVYAQAQHLLGDLSQKLIEGEGALEPSELAELLRLVENFPLLETLPSWLWPEAPKDQSNAGRLLADPRLRAQISKCLLLAQELGEGAEEVLARMPPPKGDLEPMRHFETTVQGTLVQLRELDHVHPIHRRWIRRALATGATPNRLLAIVPRIEALRGRISEEVFAYIAERVSELEEPQEIELQLQGFKDAVALLEEVLGSAEDASWEQIERTIARQAQRKSLPNLKAERPPKISIEQVWIDRKKSRVPLFFQALPGRAYGRTSLPLILRSEAPLDLELELEVLPKGPLFQPWPKGWNKPSPQQISLSRFDWRSEGTSQIYSFELSLPLRAPISGKERVELQLSLRSGGELLAERRLDWGGVLPRGGPIPFDWADRVDPSYVLDHPIGPQLSHQRILNLVAEGGSFAVIAPRRFGKTTLVEYLYEVGPKQEIIIPQPLVCTSFMGENGLDFMGLWSSLDQRLREAVGVGVQGGWREGLPGADAFEEIRSAAWEMGKRAILLLFDEAQLFFPQRSFNLGNQLKDLLERRWSRKDRPGLAPLVFGFVGLPSLRERAGANLMGQLSAFERYEIDEDDLLRVIRRISRGRLYTSRRARQHLARHTGNLYLLKTLLLRLVKEVNEQERDWAAEPDVLAMEERLRRDLEQGSEPTLSQYLRDALNDAEDINHWNPKACFPVAVALAAVGAGRISRRSRIERVTQQLNAWCETLRSSNPLIFTEDRVEEHLAKLSELGVWCRDGFNSPIFRAWLVGIASTFPGSQEDERALFRGAMERIRIPEGLEPVGEQAEASLFRFIREDRQFTLRRVLLDQEDRRERFLEALSGMEIIRKRLLHREPGGDYIFKLAEVGIAEGEDAGVQIYPWINGLSLMQKLGQLSPALVIELGHKLARALRLLHNHGVLHRDIHPKNIVLANEGLRPVLVDFGVARLNDTRMAERDEICLAPELREGLRCSRSGDIYALSSSLQNLLNPELPADEDLNEILQSCLCRQPEERLNADQLVGRFERLERDRLSSQRRAELWRSIRVLIREDIQRSWFRPIIERFKARFLAILMGLHQNPFDRCAELARFLEAVLETWPSPGERLRLSSVRSHHPVIKDQLRTPSVQLLYALYLSLDHYKPVDLKERIMERFHVGSDEALMARVIDGAGLISKAVGLTSLGEIARIILKRSML